MTKRMTLLGAALCALLYTTPALAAKTCRDSPTQAAAQKYYEELKASGKPGWRNLDRDGDGRACECNPGGNGKHCPKRR